MNWKIYSIADDSGRTWSEALLSDPKVPGYMLSHEGMVVAENATKALYDAPIHADSFMPLQKARERYLANVEQRVGYLSHLHTIVAKRCPVNKVGAPIVSDYDKISAEFWEHFLAIVCVVTGKKPGKE